MPAATADVPSVAMSFANNFWGKEDAGVGPLLDRMHSAKTTCDEMRSFYGARASIEEEYARKLLSLCRKSLGSQESGTLKISLDTVRGEVEAMAKQHQGISAQMKSELEEPLAAFAGGMKERRKIVQNTVEKLLKTKIQQTTHVNKTRDKYEQECLKIKGYLAQGHMVMGQEERKNKAKLEKTQISVVTSNAEYEAAVKALEDTTVRWNREWKAAADKFQDLEEERLDFTKSSLWTFANIASTVCVSDDSSCEKIRLSLEKMDVEGDISTFINEKGTGQEIPDAPKYINFCRGDIDGQSEVSEEDNYSVAQFPRSINPAFRSSSPQPSTFESHHNPGSDLANDLAQRDHLSNSREPILTPQKQPPMAQPPVSMQPGHQMQPMRQSMEDPQRRRPTAPAGYDAREHGSVAAVPHDPYPMDGMTMLCRTGPPGAPSDMSSQVTSNRPSSRDSHSEISNPSSFSSVDPNGSRVSPVKQDPELSSSPEKQVLKKKSGFFQNHSPFRRKSTKDVQGNPSNRNTWHASSSQNASPTRQPQPHNQDSRARNLLQSTRTASPEPIDANASLALGVGQNVLPVARPDAQNGRSQPGQQEVDENDPIAMALAELKGINLGKGSATNKQGSVRVSMDQYHGMATPGPGSHDRAAASRGTPPPSYQQTPVSRLGVPPPAVTSKAMKEASKKVANQTRNVFGGDEGAGSRGYGGSPSSRPGTRGGYDMPRAASPQPPRSASPQPQRGSNDYRRMDHRSASPNPYSGHQHRNSSQASFQQQHQKRGSDASFNHQHASPHGSVRGQSPASYREHGRPQSSYGGGSDMGVPISPAGDDGYGSQRSRGGRPDSRAMGLYDGGGGGGSRARSKSVADPARLYTRDGRPILHYARALYMYQAAIPEELGFAKGDYLAVLRHQDDGWWEAEVHGTNGRIGLVPSNYLQPC